jgi:hypothetical protein
VNGSILLDANDQMEFEVRPRMSCLTARLFFHRLCHSTSTLQENVGPMLWFQRFSEVRDIYNLLL